VGAEESLSALLPRRFCLRRGDVPTRPAFPEYRPSRRRSQSGPPQDPTGATGRL